MKKLISMALIIVNLSVFSQDHYPASLLLLNNYFSHHTIVAEKSTHTLHLYQNNNGFPKLIKSYQMATGKKAGNKIFQGDYRTPEGIYHFNDFLTHEQLLKRHGKSGEIYGVGAFVMNYPNPVDIQNKKTGGGIWLHSTNDETRIDKGLDSRGCLVAHNQNLIILSEFIELNKTNIVVVHEEKYLNKKTWEAKKANLMSTVDGWLGAWRNKDIKKYMSYYSKTNFTDPKKGGYKNYRNYKRTVFNRPGIPEIDIKNVSILSTDEYTVVTFKQIYNSSTIQDTGKKTLYLQQDSYYNWKIVAERWTKKGIDDEKKTTNMAFEPSNRFFNSEDPTQVFTKNLNLTQKIQRSKN